MQSRNVNHSVDIQSELALLRKEYATRLSGRFDNIDTLWMELRQDISNDSVLLSLYSQLHQLAGSGSTFGYARLSEIALSLESVLKLWSQQGSIPDSNGMESISARLAEMRTSAIADSERNNPEELIQRAYNGTQPLVYLVEDDDLLAKKLVLQLSSFGFYVKAFPDAHSVKQAIHSQKPMAMLVDVMLPEGELAGPALLRSLKPNIDMSDVAVVFITAHDDINARIAAAICGADSFYVKPLDVPLIAERLNWLMRRSEVEPIHVLIVDDDKILANHYALLLRDSGMEVNILNDSTSVLDFLQCEQPDLILMDIDMPECNGIVLAKVIRQYDRYLSLPIVYLSTASNLEVQQLAMREGGDDFLTKPISTQQLISSVTIRAQHGREMRQQLTSDNLTGLMAHGPLKERLTTELARAERTGEDIVFVLLDIDHFKGVNDNYGHPTGDHILRSLANLLRRRIRLSDTIGRYGGEEFGIILSNCNKNNAMQMVDELRQDFEQVKYRCEDREFGITFSAGMAIPHRGISVDELIQLADEALHQAKLSGRNQVLSA